VRYEYPPYHQSVLHEVVPIYETLPGWQSDITAFTRYDQLPSAAKEYVNFLQETTGVRISVVGVGPGREQFVRPS
jgi:adenylosuccinate synthase